MNTEDTVSTLIYWTGAPEKRAEFRDLLGEYRCSQQIEKNYSLFINQERNPNFDLEEIRERFVLTLKNYSDEELVQHLWSHWLPELSLRQYDDHIIFDTYLGVRQELMCEFSKRFPDLLFEVYECCFDVGSETYHGVFRNGRTLLFNKAYGSIRAYALACQAMITKPNQGLEDDDLLLEFYQQETERMLAPPRTPTPEEMEQQKRRDEEFIKMWKREMGLLDDEANNQQEDGQRRPSDHDGSEDSDSSYDDAPFE